VSAAEDTFGDNVCILTSPCRTAGCTDGKLDWVAKHFPSFQRRVLLGSAKHFCAHPKALLVDDHDENVAEFRRAGGVGLLVPQPWNERRNLPADIVPLAIQLAGGLMQ
jgi:hypothetical protein